MTKPVKEDFEVKEIQEGNKKYYKLAGLLFSESAYANLHQLATKPGLRIKLNRGGCSGFKYHYDFYDAPEEGEQTYKLSDQLSIFMDDFTYEKTKGSVVDYEIGLHGSGMKIKNPHVKNSCSCGVSYGF